MLTYNWKVIQSKVGKDAIFEPDFDSILEQILNLDIEKNLSKSWSMKSLCKLNENKKLAGPTLDTYFYCNKSSYSKNKCYYKYS